MKGKTGGWESTLDPEEEKEFWVLLRDIDKLRKIRFLRSINPKEDQFRKPFLMAFGEGSQEACCSLVHLRWERDDGNIECRLVTGKTQVAPKVKIIIPWME
jgi:hypothetical protein